MESDGEAQALVKLQKALTQQERASVTSMTCIRFLRGCDGVPDDAAKLLKESLQWRRCRTTHATGCRACMEQRGTHPWRQVGVDLWGRPVIYYCFAQGVSKGDYSPATVNSHLMHTMENALRSSTPIESCVWIVDFSGFCFSDMSTGTRPSPDSPCCAPHVPSLPSYPSLLQCSSCSALRWTSSRSITRTLWLISWP